MSRARISAFYGYKGGAGRSFTLAHVAWLLARGHGRKVLVIDADLEAPGLGDFFGTTSPRFDRVWREAPGMLDLLYTYGDTSNAEELAGRLKADRVFDVIGDGGRYLHRIGKAAERSGIIDLMGPGQLRVPVNDDTRNPSYDYASALLDQDWTGFYGAGGLAFFNRFGEILRGQRWDDVLIDMRTGLSQSSARTIVAMADDLVLFAAPSFQSLDGLAAMKRWLHRERLDLIEQTGWTVAAFRTAAILSRLEPDGSEVAQLLFHLKFADVTRFIVPSFSGLQAEDLFASRDPTLVTRLSEIAAWLAFLSSEPIASERALASLRNLQSALTEKQRDVATMAHQLLEDTRKSFTPQPAGSMPPHSAGPSVATKGNNTHSFPIETDWSVFLERYAQLKLLEVDLFDNLALQDVDADEFKKIFSIESKSRDLYPPDRSTTPATDLKAPPHVTRPVVLFTPEQVAALVEQAGLNDLIDNKAAEFRLPLPVGNAEDIVRRATMAADLIGRAAFLDKSGAFSLALGVIEELWEREAELNQRQRWALGYALVSAGDYLRDLGGEYLARAEQLLQKGWQTGALYSAGQPPLGNETSGLITYAFLLCGTERTGAGRATLREVHDAVVKHADQLDDTSIYATVRRNFAWWDATISLQGSEGDRCDGVDHGVTGPAVTVDSGPLNDDERSSLDGWLATVYRWRGKSDLALQAAERRLHKLRFYDWTGVPARLRNLQILSIKAELELTLFKGEDAAYSLAAATNWAEPPSELFESWLVSYRMMVVLLKGIGNDFAAGQALNLVEASGLFETACADTGISMTDLRLRYPVLVRAALTAVRLGDNRADRFIGQMSAILSRPSRLLENAWADESRYLLECARNARCGQSRRQAVLDIACRRIAGDDHDVASETRRAFTRLADMWLAPQHSTVS